MISSALRLLAARVATTKVKMSEAKIAANMRKVVRSAYSGRFSGSRTIGCPTSRSAGTAIWRAPWARIAKAAAIRMKIARS